MNKFFTKLKNFINYRVKLLLTSINNILNILLLSFKKFELKDSIIILSEARGGSTWLMELISKCTDTAIQWEPLHVEKGIIPKHFNFGWRPKIEENNTNKQLNQVFKDIFTYKKHNYWTRKFVNPIKIIRAKHVLIKFVRANNLSRYLINHFNFKHKPILLVRHPIDTCMSQIRAFGETDLNKIEINDKLLKSLKYKSKNQVSQLEVKIITWLENNMYCLEKINSDKLYVIHYYNLVIDTKEQLKLLFNNLGLVLNNDVLNKLDYKKSSVTDFKKDLSINNQIQLNKNINKLSTAEKNRIYTIFEFYNFNLYNLETARPL